MSDIAFLTATALMGAKVFSCLAGVVASISVISISRDLFRKLKRREHPRASVGEPPGHYPSPRSSVVIRNMDFASTIVIHRLPGSRKLESTTEQTARIDIDITESKTPRRILVVENG